MGRIGLAFKVFFQVLFNAARAEQIRKVEALPEDVNPVASEPVDVVTESRPQASPVPVPRVTGRSDALTLLETLQREARLIDFLQEEIDGYNDQQIGSAVREIHRGCRTVLQRMFRIVPVVEGTEGTPFTVRGNEGAAQIRLIGKVVETRPVSGTLVHAGWKAERCDTPQWQGDDGAKLILAPAEVEL